MTDLFLSHHTDEMFDKIFETIACCPNIAFQILTKRAERMEDYLSEIVAGRMYEFSSQAFANFANDMPNVWLGVSAENQEQADERIPLLLQTSASKRFVSLEPLLGKVKLVDIIDNVTEFLQSDAGEGIDYYDFLENADWNYLGHKYEAKYNADLGMSFCATCGNRQANPMHNNRPPQSEWQYLDWVIIGGESGHNARPFHLEWAETIIDDCKNADVPVFFKQAGGNVIHNGKQLKLQNKKGGNLAELPEFCRVREFPC